VTLFLIDASHYQSGLPVASLRAQGFAALIAKATEGTGFVDSAFAGWVGAAREAGLPFAAYHFLHTGNLAAQATHTASVVPADVPVWIDVEGGPSRDDAYGYAASLRARGGRVAGIYHGAQPRSGFGGWWRAAYFQDPTGSAVDAYAAQGGDGGPGWSAGQTRHPDIWQFCQHGRIHGFSGDVDLNAYRGSLDQLVKTGWFWVPDTLKGADLVLDGQTETQLRKAVREEVQALLAADIVPAGEYRPDLVSKDPTHGGQGFAPVLLTAARASLDANGALTHVANQLGAITATLAAIQAQQPDLNVDLPALAQQIAAALPDDLARELADELARRLAQ
jgi:GH25 family lysozyme M1 (1,4-beta-N-acetylmuramidase)